MSEAEAVGRKKRILAGHKGSTTRIITQVYETLGGERGRLHGATLSRLRQYSEALKEKSDLLKRLDGEILELVKEEELEEEIEQADVFSEKIQLALIELSDALGKGHAPGTPSPPPDVRMGIEPTAEHTGEPPAPSTGIPESTESVCREYVSQVKLPKLVLKKFDGNVTNWITFWDSFESAIHSNTGLSNVEKFNYLTSMLERNAAEAISGLTLTAANYEEAIAILKRRFGNKQQIINKHMEILLNVEPVTAQNSLKGLRHLYDVVEAHTRGLKALGVSSESYGNLLTSVLMNKLPSDLRLIVSRRVTESEWDLDMLMKLMEEEINARERAGISSVQLPRRPTRDPPTAAALMSSDTRPMCSFCEHPHPSSLCKIVTNPEARKQILRRTGRCFVCLRKNHISRQCRSSLKCLDCNGRHHSSICPRLAPTSTPTTQPTSLVTGGNQGLNPMSPEFPQPRNNEKTEAHAHGTARHQTTSMHVNMKVPVLLQTAKALVYNPKCAHATADVRIILDSGSQRSYLSDRVKNSLSLQPIQSETMSIKTFGSSDDNKLSCDVVNLGFQLKDGDCFELPLFSVPFICEPLSSQDIDLSTPLYKHLADLDLADRPCGNGRVEVDILIGCDHYWKFVIPGIIGKEQGPTAINTRLGWVLSGPLAKPTADIDLPVTVFSTHSLKISSDVRSENEELNNNLKRFWELESLGISTNEQSVYDKFTNMITFKNGRYEVHLPWKESHQVLPDNYHLSLKRLTNLLRRLRQEPNILQEYDSVIKDQLRRGIVEQVTEPSTLSVARVHYLPHHCVIRKDKQTSKLRIVYDASARSQGPSLNDCLYTGPKFSQNIMEILTRFRIHHVALAGDIEKAFLMVSVNQEDRDVLRFLWIDDISKKTPKIQVFRFTRVIFGVSSSPFLLNATVRHHIEGYKDKDPEFVDKFLRSIYVDDLSLGTSDVESAYELYAKSRQRLAQGGFTLRKFVTNSNTLKERIDLNEQTLKPGRLNPTTSEMCEDMSYTKETLGDKYESNDNEQKILGICWNPVVDELVFDIGRVIREFPEPEPTKRNVVSLASKFYDPLGIVTPITVRFKTLFQRLCITKVAWDETLSGELLERWQTLLSSLRKAEPIYVPRCYFPKPGHQNSICKLIGFCDASVEAYAAVVYIKECTDVRSTPRILASKTRVAPISGVTIPRLELLAALLLARLMDLVSQSLAPETTLKDPACFTDSKVALYWIKGEGREWKQFVQNRACEIRRLVSAQFWKHCPGVENPADIPSRGMNPQQLRSSKLWFNGPQWLLESEEHDSTEEQDCPIPQECLAEMKVKQLQEMQLTAILATDGGSGLSQLINCEDYSKLTRLLAITALILKFVKLLKQRVQRKVNGEAPSITSDDIMRAEKHWIIDSQGGLVQQPKFKIWKHQLGLFQDKAGIWRCRGRLEHSALPPSSVYPVLLDNKHPLTRLIVMDCHERVQHNGVKETLTQLRSQYWIIRGRSLVRKLLHSCVICRKAEGKPFEPLPPPPLPEFRVKEQPPFTYTGVDFAGPLYVKDGTFNRKTWICLYTCCVVRAVHLDLVPDLSTPTFIRSFKRFTARRGFPTKVISDNGKTFKSAAKYIETIFKDPEVKTYFAQFRMEWQFNLERAPWWGGLFERMVRSTKRCLKKTIGQARLTYDELLTALAEVEMILNSRPLSYVSSEDLEEPLTPSHLLIGRRALNLPDLSVYDGGDAEDYNPSVSGSDLTRRMKHLGNVLDHFWRRWRSEYLLELRESHRYAHTGRAHQDPRVTVGDIVLVYSDTQPRGLWRMAKVEKLIKGSDGRVRGVFVRAGTRGKGTTVLKRPIQHLYPLEINCPSLNCESGMQEEETALPKIVDEPQRVAVNNPSTDRPQRMAARAGRARVKNWVKELSK